jgi:NADH:ubiquinone oxidoreductase subunit 3 (subunit A)
MLPTYDIGLALTIFFLVGLGMLCFVLFLSWAVRPLKERPKSQETYECGFPAKGDARAIGFNYMNYAILFLIFDLAALYLFLYASLPEAPTAVTVSFILGVATLGLMILYGTKKRRYYVA